MALTPTQTPISAITLPNHVTKIKTRESLMSQRLIDTSHHHKGDNE